MNKNSGKIKLMKLDYQEFYKSCGIEIKLQDPSDEVYLEVFPKLENEELNELNINNSEKNTDYEFIQKLNANYINDIVKGYDFNDPFIDNADVYNDVMLPTVKTEYDGFYINYGKLKIDKNDKNDTPKNQRKMKKDIKTPTQTKADESEEKNRKRCKTLTFDENKPSNENANEDNDNGKSILEQFSSTNLIIFENIINNIKNNEQWLTNEISDDNIWKEFCMLCLNLPKMKRTKIMNYISSQVNFSPNILLEQYSSFHINTFQKIQKDQIHLLKSDLNKKKFPSLIEFIGYIVDSKHFFEFCSLHGKLLTIERYRKRKINSTQFEILYGEIFKELCPDNTPKDEFFYKIYLLLACKNNKPKMLKAINFLKLLAINYGADAEEIDSKVEQINQNYSDSQKPNSVTKEGDHVPSKIIQESIIQAKINENDINIIKSKISQTAGINKIKDENIKDLNPESSTTQKPNSHNTKKRQTE